MPERHHEAENLDQGVSLTEMILVEDRKRGRGDTSDHSPTSSTSKRQKPAEDLESDERGHTGRRTLVTLSREDYTVGWICALHIEMAVAEAMLDIVHEKLPSCDNDSNTYILGNIAMHNIAIACLPSGHYGTNKAASVASNMHRTFPSIRIRLLVGIGGGVPRKVDVRLGDVVVGDSVLQYDMGKVVGVGKLERTGTPNRPPEALLTATATLRASHESKPSRIPSILSDMLERYPKMTQYANRGPLRDRLFDGTYEHTGSMNDCEHCDTSRLVARPTRSCTHPMIHYGTIASGNLVMKHGEARDQLAHELNIICFEMEAAGLKDSFPCLVVRGICDYSDSHKNKQWQKYAAATAAAYAKELLSVIPASGVKRTPVVTVLPANADRRKNLLGSLKFDQIDDRRSNIKANHSNTCGWLLEHPDYQDWRDPEKAVEHHGFLWIRGKPGAGKSTIMNFAYTQAKKDKANTVISFFFNLRGDSAEHSITGMYRSLLFQLINAQPRLLEVFDEPKHKSSLDDLHATLISQRRQPVWQVAVLQDLLRSAIVGLDQQSLIIFVDALDESNADEVEEIVEYFEKLGEDAVLNRKRLTICFSSRHYPYIDIQYGRKLMLERQEGHEKDIATYIKSKLKVGESKTAKEIKAEVQAKASGVFMWVVLVVDILKAEFRGGRIFNVRKRLNALPTGLIDLFREILQRDQINMQDLRLCIQWILFAKRPLKLEEYYFAAVSGLSPDELREWDPEEISRDDMSKFVLSSSKGLAETTKSKSATVQFIHESVREFFLKDGQRELWPNFTAEDFQNVSHGQLSQCCLAYIKLNTSDYVPSDESLLKSSSNQAKILRNLVSAKFPFLEYATRHVLYHADATDGDSQYKLLKDFALEVWINHDNLFQIYENRRHTSTASLLYIIAEKNLARLIPAALRLDPRIDIQGERHGYPLFAALSNGHREAVKSLLQETIHPDSDFAAQLEYGRDFKAHKGQTPLSWAAENGHLAVVRVLLNNGADIDPDSKITSGRTLLSLAAENGHEEIIRLLLEKNADIEGSSPGRTPLSYAAEKGHETVVKLLLENNADIETWSSSRRTPLSFAAEEGHEAIVKLLLEKNANIETRDTYSNWTPLLYAAEKGHETVVKLLLENNADIETSSSRQTPLSFAAEEGHEAVVKLLLEKNADIETRSSSRQTPLSLAAEKGHEAVVKLLLEKNADIETRNSYGQTPLSFAVEKGHETVVKLLLENNADIETKSSSSYPGQTPLSFAAEKGHEAVAKLLLEKNADIETKSSSGWNPGRTPLSFAAEKGHEAVVKLLLKNNADIETKCTFNQTPLSYAAEKGHEAVVKLLLENNADIETRSSSGQTPLSFAAEKGHETVVKLLLEKNADIEMRSSSGRTPLSFAAEKGHEAVVKLLLENNADIETKSSSGQTPLSFAAEKGHEAVVKLLLENNADIETRSISGETPLSYAAGKGHRAVVKLLKQHKNR